MQVKVREWRKVCRRTYLKCALLAATVASMSRLSFTPERAAVGGRLLFGNALKCCNDCCEDAKRPSEKRIFHDRFGPIAAIAANLLRISVTHQRPSGWSENQSA